VCHCIDRDNNSDIVVVVIVVVDDDDDDVHDVPKSEKVMDVA